jgi:hypothetical protein
MDAADPATIVESFITLFLWIQLMFVRNAGIFRHVIRAGTTFYRRLCSII